ncbi:MAG: outer membrane beta-barrel protein, partial [Bacteroidota bacterium]
ADLDKKQAVVYKQRANRFKLLSIILLLIIFSFTAWHYLIPTSTSNKLENGVTENISASNKASSNNIVTENNSTSNIPSENLIPSKNKNTSATDKENNNPKLNQSQKSQLSFVIDTIRKQKNIRSIQKQNQNNIASIISYPTDMNEIIAESNSTKANSISNEVVNVANDSDKTNTTVQNILMANIPDNGLPQLTDTNKSETPYFIKSDSMFNKDLHSKSRLSIAVFYSPNQSWCNLKDNTNDNFDDVAMYNNRENLKYSFTAGLTLKYDINNKWSLLSGATYSQIAKTITIQTMYAEANAANEMHFQYPTSNGVIEMPSDDSHANLHPGDSINAKAVCNQSIKFINVPLMVRVQLTKNKFTWYANAGVSANFIVQEKAKINMNNSETTIINHINGLKKMNYGFLIGTGVQYNMYNDFGIFIEPMFRGSFTSITQNTSVNSYPYSLGLNLGFSLHF